MDAKEYLDQYLELKGLILCKKAENEQWEAIAGGINPPTQGDKVQSSGNLHRTEDAIIKYMRIKEQNNKQIEYWESKIEEIFSVINQLHSVTHKKIIIRHYLEEKSFVEIAAEIKYSYVRTIELHKEALENVQIILNSI